MILSERILVLLCIAMAVSVVSITVTKAVIFKRVREWIENRSVFFGELFSCPFCFSFYVTLGFLVISPFNVVPSFGYMSIVLTYFVVIGIAAVFTGIIYHLFSLME